MGVPSFRLCTVSRRSALTVGVKYNSAGAGAPVLGDCVGQVSLGPG